MIKLFNEGVFVKNGREVIAQPDATLDRNAARKQTIAYNILKAHNKSGNDEDLKIEFDCIASHDITYVNIVQTAKASGLTRFPKPYILTNCHNSLCAVGGTINEDDHLFGLTAAKKYGGIFVPAHQAVIHAFMREYAARCGSMILGSDSHTRYGALGTMAIGEGGGELVKQLLSKTYDVAYPDIVGVMLRGKPQPYVGPQDVALALIAMVFNSGFVKNRVMEFIGDGIASLSVDYRNGIDVMTTETTCLSSIWETDDAVREYFSIHGDEGRYKKLAPGAVAYYDRFIEIDLSKIEPMIALPFHPSNAVTISEFNKNPSDILRTFLSESEADVLMSKVQDGRICVDQAVIAGCAGGTFENLCISADMLAGKAIGSDAFTMSVYPASQPIMDALLKNGKASELLPAGVTLRTAFCGPCFGAGDVPYHNGFSIRHTTRNFPSREGSKPAQNQKAFVALMDARSITASAINGGRITSAAEVWEDRLTDAKYPYSFNNDIYKNRVYYGFDKTDAQAEFPYAPNITDWPEFSAMPKNMLLKVAAFIPDAVTTTDELIPSGDTSSYRSNPVALSKFTLSRRDPDYVKRSEDIRELEQMRKQASVDLIEAIKAADPMTASAIKKINECLGADIAETGIGSVIYCTKPGDGSAREQAASCQRVLGGTANIAKEYATKRYRSNLINWGIVPFTITDEPTFGLHDFIFVPNIQDSVKSAPTEIKAYVLAGDIKDSGPAEITLNIQAMTDEEKQILLNGCLINHYKAR